MNEIELNNVNKEYLEKQLNLLQQSSNSECEIRFGSFTYRNENAKSYQQTKTPVFISNVDIEFFYRLKNELDIHKYKKNTLYTTEYSYENTDDKKSKLREIIYTDSNFNEITNKEHIYMLKSTYHKHDIYDYNCRISSSYEKILEKKMIYGIDFNNISFIRNKNRISYIFDCGHLDLTIVNQGFTKDTLNVQYEIEFEITKNDYHAVLRMLTFILQVKQHNVFVISSTEQNNIINEYRNLVMPNKNIGRPYFIGSQPETLQKYQLSQLFKELYSVTDKADGDRYFMFINSNGNIYFIDSNITGILKTNLKSKYTNSIIDGELINDNKFYAFDILYYNGKDLRGNTNYYLRERLDLVNSINLSIDENTQQFFKVQIKTFIFRNVFLGSEVIMNDIDKKSYKNDGLIFTPMNEPYPIAKKWSKLLKWKPVELNTIDFFSIKKTNDDGTFYWELYVQEIVPIENPNNTLIYKPTQKPKTQLVLFDIKTICKTSEFTQDITFKTTFNDDLLDPTTNEPFKSNTVIEYHWNKELSKFIPLKTRWDKTANPSKHGNFSYVACNIWNTINNPITSTQLFKMNNNSTAVISKKDFFFERLNFLTSEIYNYLITKYIDKSQYILELNTNLTELRKNSELIKSNTKVYTYNNTFKESNINYLNFKLDVNINTACNIINQNLPPNVYFDTCIILEFNSFFKSKETFQNLLKILEYNIKNNAKIIISFIEIPPLTHTSYSKNNEIMYYIGKEQNADHITLNTDRVSGQGSEQGSGQGNIEENITETVSGHNHWGKYNKIFINGKNSENNMDTYQVNFKTLLNIMNTYGYTCEDNDNDECVSYYDLYLAIKSDLPSNKLLLNYEEDISKLYKFCIFEKVKKNIEIINTTITKERNLPIPQSLSQEQLTQEQLTQEQLTQEQIQEQIQEQMLSQELSKIKLSDLMYFKINTTHDIYNILNCIKFTYFNTEKKDISSFSNIKEVFDNELKEYTPYMQNYSNLNNLNNNIYFYEYLYEELDETLNEKIILHNYYIILYKNKIILDNNTIQLLEQKLIELPPVLSKESTKEEKINKNLDDTLNNVSGQGNLEIKAFVYSIKETTTIKPKITIIKLKEYLKILKLKTSGNKDELLERLIKYYE